jgi:spore coat polysaccharide biosynthesis protein SpsF (cytidylyltransferase family)
MNSYNQFVGMDNLCVVQARMSSSRFPGKVLAPFADSTVIEVLLGRVARSKSLSRVVVATSEDSSDDVLSDLIGDDFIFRGNLLDVRSRFIELAKIFDPQNIVRITGDCPLVCFELIDQMMSVHISTNADYTANSNVNRYPKGFDVEIFKSEVLFRTDFQTNDLYQKEHVTPWMYTSGLLNVTNIEFFDEEKTKDLNFSVDTPSDLDFLQSLEVEHSISKHPFQEIWRRITYSNN